MPALLKAALSVLVLLISGIAYIHQDSIGQHGPKFALMLLAPFMVVAMWIFPEVTGNKPRAPRDIARK